MISAGGEGCWIHARSLFFFFSHDPPHLSHLFLDISFHAASHHGLSAAFVSVHSIFLSRVLVVLAGVGQPLYDG